MPWSVGRVLHLAVFYTALLSACGYAFWRGGGPERATAGTMLAGVAVTWMTLSAPTTRYRQPETVTLVIDVAVLAAFVAIALRSNRRWPLAVTALHGLSVAAHLTRMIQPDMIRVVYKTVMVVWVYPQMMILAIGVRRHQTRLRISGADPSWSTFYRPSSG